MSSNNSIVTKKEYDSKFVLEMIEILKKKLNNTKNESRKDILNKLIYKSNEIEKAINEGTSYSLEALINEIEKFYLKTTYVSNGTRKSFYEKVYQYYNKKNNNEKYKIQLRKILLNKKLSYTPIGQIFNPASKRRRTEINSFLEEPNEILNKFNKITTFYKESKKPANQNIFEDFITKFELHYLVKNTTIALQTTDCNLRIFFLHKKFYKI